jgi:hypothetical protein
MQALDTYFQLRDEIFFADSRYSAESASTVFVPVGLVTHKDIVKVPGADVLPAVSVAKTSMRL